MPEQLFLSYYPRNSIATEVGDGTMHFPKKRMALLIAALVTYTNVNAATTSSSIDNTRLVSGHDSKLCLAVMGNFANTTVPVGVTTCDGSAATQRWRLSGGQLISQANAAYCLSASNLMNYGQLSMKRCGSAANQQWQYQSGVLVTGSYAIDLNRSNNSIILYSRHGGVNQQWRPPADIGTNPQAGGQMLTSGYNNQLCLTVKGNDLTSGMLPVGSAACDSNASQRWVRETDNRIKSQLNPAYCLTADALNNYGNVSIRRCASAANQQWQYDNQVLSINGYAVDLARESGAVIMYSKHGGNNQQWLGLSAGTSTENPAKYEVVNALGFYDLNAQGKPRTLRNDLQGTLAAQVQFAQSHTVDPAGNTARNMPSIVAEREALLLLMPSDSKAEFISVSVYSNGMLLGKLEMQHPNRLMASDYANGDNRTDVIYSRRAWSAVLPWNWVKPGLSLEFEANNGDHGELPSTAIEYAAPAELVLHSLRLGMLTNPPKSEGHRLLLAPEDATTDYFQTIPVARLVNAYYQDMQLDEVIVQNGRVYTSVSDDEGGTYDGDMREDVAKGQISTGINLANFGISSSDNDQNNPHLTARITIHHAAGNYRNGVQGHGLSGGNGIATLYDSEGNELSHELGHNYGLGHYPGSVGNDYFWSAHHADSGWGYIAHRQRMRANLDWTAKGDGAEINGVKTNITFKGIYSYNADAMSGGSVVSALSHYTHHTGYSALRIQQFLDKPIADLAYASGYKKWDRTQQKFVEYRPGSNYPVPQKIGVPVITLLGGYDPLNNRAVIYPAFRSNYGNVFDLDIGSVGSNDCALEVFFADGSRDIVKLAGKRYNSSIINQFQLNIEEARQPSQANLVCYRNGSRYPLAQLAIPTHLTSLKAPVIVGKAQRFKQLQAKELAAIKPKLLAQANNAAPVLDAQTALIVQSYAGDLSALDASAKAVAERYLALQRNLKVLQGWIAANAAALSQNQRVAIDALRQQLIAMSLNVNGLYPLAGSMIRGASSDRCMAVSTGNAVKMLDTTQCTNVATQRWSMDLRGALHPLSDPARCLQVSSDGAVIGDCAPGAVGQSWRVEADGTLRNNASSKCMDVADGVDVITYGCHAGSNQRFTGVTRNDNVLFSNLPTTALQRLLQVVSQLK